MNKTKFSIVLPIFAGASAFDYGVKIQELKGTVELAEKLGFNSIWVPDHLTLGYQGEILEAWTVLAAASQLCKRMHLGGLVLCVSHRAPALLAKMTSTLDVLSNGRVELGIGAGWRASEQLSYGLPWNPSLRERLQQLTEAIEIIKGMWANESFSYSGKYFKVDRAICVPKPVQKPHPRIWIGGAGEKLTLRTVAKYADGWNVGNVSPEEYAHKLNVLRAHCDSVGTDYARIEKSLDIPILLTEKKSELLQVAEWSRWFAEISSEGKSMIPPVGDLKEMKQKYILGSVPEVTERIREYVAAGVKHFMFECLDLPSTNSMKLLAENVIPNIS